MQTQAAVMGESADFESDLGPLAWVLDELRKSLDGATKALRRFVRDAELSRGSDLAALDSSQLRIARQQLHQAVGALEMVGLEVPAKMLRAMEALAQKFVQKPEFCSDAAALKVERASFALTDYLEGLLKGKQQSAVALFPQYRDVLDLLGEDRVHPADLWQHAWRWVDVPVPPSVKPLAYDSAVRSRIDGLILNVVKAAHGPSAKAMGDISLGFAAAQKELHPRLLWAVVAAYFEAVALGLCATDIYTKRAASRVLLQYRTLARGEPDISERLLQDLLFFCAQAVPAATQDAPALRAVQLAYGLTHPVRVNYEKPQFGRFDPTLLAQARKRIAAATETWSSLAGGDTSRIKPAVDQFSLVADSIVKLHPDSVELARALTRVMDSVSRSASAPAPSLAMEVATAVLYLEAAYDDLDPTSEQMVQRGNRLAQRLDFVLAGGQPDPLDEWMEELYRRVSDRQTMGSVVDELRTTLGEVESSLDSYFRNPDEKASLHEVPGRLAQMRGVFSVLGLDQAAMAALRMRDTVARCLADTAVGGASNVFEKLGNSLGALGFLIDMLSYQRELAKKLFVYDEELGEFRSVMGRQKAEPPEMPAQVQASLLPVSSPPETATLPVTPQPEAFLQTVVIDSPAQVVVPTAVPAPAVVVAELDDDDAELRDIFIDEAREVVQNGFAAIAALHDNGADFDQQTTLRRAFHTLKGSSRMVGLTEFGEAGWAMEQVLNAWLPQQLPATPDLLNLAGQAMKGFAQWVEDIAAGTDGAWRALPFRQAADRLRLEGIGADLVLPNAVAGALAADQPTTPVEVAVPAAQSPSDLPAILSPAEQPERLAVPLQSVADASVEGETEEIEMTDDFADSVGLTESTQTPVNFLATQELRFDDTQAFDFGPAAGAADTESEGSPAPHAEFGVDLLDVSFDNLQQVHPEQTLAMPADASQSAETQLPAEDITAQVAAVEPAVSDLDTVDVPEDADLPDLTTAMAAPADQSDVLADLFAADLLDAEAVSEPAIVDVVTLPDEVSLLDGPEPEPESEPELADDEQVKVIGTLRIGLGLYNVYLNEADEWSRRLLTELTEWSIELNHQLPDSCVVLAHSLAGSSATVGFMALSDLARALEGALEHTQLLGTPGISAHADLFVEVAEDIRRLLHQFAAGFLKQPDPAYLPALQAILDVSTEASPAFEPEDDATADDVLGEIDLDFGPDMLPLAAVSDLESLPESEQLIELEPPFALEVEPELEIEPESLPALEQAAASVAPVSVQPESEDEIEAIDTLDVDLFPIFEEEALELLPQLDRSLRQWSASPGLAGARQQMLRALHTLKGSARLAGAMRLGEMAHRMESAAEKIDMEEPSSVNINRLLARLDNISACFDALRATPISALMLPEQPFAPVPVAEAAQPALAFMASVESSGTVAVTPAPAPLPTAPLNQFARRGSGHTTRVKSQLLDHMVNQTGEVMITRSRMESRLGQLRGAMGELTVNLDRLRGQLRDMELQSESQMQSRLAQTKDAAQGFDPLEFDRFTRVQELTRMMAESVHDVATLQRSLQQTVEGVEDDLIAQARLTRELQRDLLRTRMVEFDSLADRFYAVVRLAGKEFDKSVKLDIVGGALDMDRGVLERVAPAFEHLLRNAVGHGIEPAAVREAAGKSPTGTISIKVEHHSNDVMVTLSDDGGGLNLARIREKAIAQGQISEDQNLSDDEIANLIFTSGLSTASVVTEMSGRGIGMDVVRTEVIGLGGRVELATQPGQGTQFKLVMPLTTAVTQVVLLRMGEVVMGVPSNLVEIVRRIPVAELDAAYQSQHFDYGGESLAFFWAGALLQVSAASFEQRGRTAVVAVLRSAGQRVALHVDEVLGNREAVVKNLGPQLVHLPGLAGMSVLASGAVVLIYNPVALANSYGPRVRAFGQAGSNAQPSKIIGPSSGQSLPSATDQLPLVLVVDDSITVRRVTQRLLKREGFRVALAVDGLNALEVLQNEKPAVVLTDIEMPRMDGFDLVRNIRADNTMKDMPIIMITSRIAEKHREYARALKVDHYLGKPYPEDELIARVRAYCHTESP